MLTIGTTGTNGNSTQGVAVGASGGNNAVDTFVQMAGGNSVTRSSPFVDYEFDEAFVGDDHGFLHKFTGVFNGTLAEVVDGFWPANVGADTILTSPVVFNGRIFFGGDNGRLYCVLATEGLLPDLEHRRWYRRPFSMRRSWMAAPAAYSWRLRMRQGAILVQTTINIWTTPITVRMGNRTPLGFDIHNGAFDHNYLTGADPSAGFMYFCGVATSGAAPTLYRVGFNSIGRVNDTRDANSLQLTNAVTDNDVCSPLTEIYNPSTPGGPTDLLFVTIARNNQPAAEDSTATVWPVWTLRRGSRATFDRSFNCRRARARARAPSSSTTSRTSCRPGWQVRQTLLMT